MNFKEAYKKPFLGSKATQTASGGVRAGVQSGFLTTSGVHIADFISTAAPYDLGVGVFGFVNPNSGLSVAVGSAEVTGGKMLRLGNTSMQPVDQIGMHTGYQLASTSRNINPRFITGFKKVACAKPEQAVCHLGNTKFTFDVTASITTAGAGYTNGTYQVEFDGSGNGEGLVAEVVVAVGAVTSIVILSPGVDFVVGEVLTPVTAIPWASTPGTNYVITLDTYSFCKYDFECGETYKLELAIGGDPVIAALNHETPRMVSAYGGCCPIDPDVSKLIDSTLVMIDWAKGIVESPYFKHFIRPIVYDQSNQPWFATSAEAVAAGYASNKTWANYVSPGYIVGATGGIRLASAYVDTTFGTCSFQYSDSKGIVTPVRIISVSLVNDAALPCKDTLCFTCETAGFGVQGHGETVLREFISDASERTNMFSEDQRMREIEGGSALLANISRSGLYMRYIIEHYIPENKNNATTFSDINYELNIYIPCANGVAPTTTAFETFMSTWLTAAGSQVTLESFGHTPFSYSGI